MNKYETVADLKNCEEDIVIFGAGKIGKDVIKLFKKNDIDIACICDNNREKHGTLYHNIEVLSLKDTLNNYKSPIFLVCIHMNSIEIINQLETIDIFNYYVIPVVYTPIIEEFELISKNDIINNNKILERDKELISKFKNIHLNKRCFIIGNGPSLKACDLDKLQNEYTFASNFIYKIFDDTNWRPSYYTAADLYFIKNFGNEIKQLKTLQNFLIYESTSVKKTINNFCNVRRVYYDDYPRLPKISTDACSGLYDSYTITYQNIQLAISMGFKEIIFLGMDHNFQNVQLADNTKIKMDGINDHFYKDVISKFKHVTIYSLLEKTTLGYQKVKQYGDENGIKMLNATRGGKLEVFERVDFDTLF